MIKIVRLGCIFFVLFSGLVFWGTGCSYTVKFNPEQKINTKPDSVHGYPLEVNILCLTHKDCEKHPELTGFTARNWFEKENKPVQYQDLADKVYLLTDNAPSKNWGKRLGSPLRGLEHEPRPPTVRIYHSEPFNGQSTILIFARFLNEKGEIDNTENGVLNLRPPSKYRPTVLINVTGTNIYYAESKK